MEKNSLLPFFGVLSSKIRCCLLTENSISKLGFFRNENVDGLDSKFNRSETQERTAGLASNKKNPFQINETDFLF
jgi:hypothetical protein